MPRQRKYIINLFTMNEKEGLYYTMHYRQRDIKIKGMIQFHAMELECKGHSHSKTLLTVGMK